MVEAVLETVTTGQAAALLGVHRNTVINRVKTGRYDARVVHTPRGPTYIIELASLDLPTREDVLDASPAEALDDRLAALSQALEYSLSEIERLHANLAVAEREVLALRTLLPRLRVDGDGAG